MNVDQEEWNKLVTDVAYIRGKIDERDKGKDDNIKAVGLVITFCMAAIALFKQFTGG